MRIATTVFHHKLKSSSRELSGECRGRKDISWTKSHIGLSSLGFHPRTLRSSALESPARVDREITRVCCLTCLTPSERRDILAQTRRPCTFRDQKPHLATLPRHTRHHHHHTIIESQYSTLTTSTKMMKI